SRMKRGLFGSKRRLSIRISISFNIDCLLINVAPVKVGNQGEQLLNRRYGTRGVCEFVQRDRLQDGINLKEPSFPVVMSKFFGAYCPHFARVSLFLLDFTKHVAFFLLIVVRKNLVEI